MEQKQKPMYSVIIPTYNEATKEEEMRDHLRSVEDYFVNLRQAYEILIVLDGPTDETPEVVRKNTANLKNVRIIDRKENRGKGFSVREGLLAANGQIRLFTDMDGATPIRMLDRMIPKFQQGADLVIGSRDLEESEVEIHQPKWKEFLGNAGNVLIQAVAGLWGIKDTQCGFKAFTEKVVKDVVPRATINRWGLDFELLMMAKKLGYKIEQVPVKWYDRGASTVGLKGYFITFRELFKVRWNMLAGVYKLRKKVAEPELQKM